jgi:F-type H+-transporting ATPase subunit gamma
METLQSLTRRLKTTNALQSVVRTMKSLSMVSLRQFEQAERAVGVYERTISLGLQALLHAETITAAPRSGPRSHKRVTAILVIGSDYGLCGRFNERLAEFIVEQLAAADLDIADTPMLVAGHRISARISTLGGKISDLDAMPGTVAAITPRTDAVLTRLDQWQDDPSIERIVLFHNARDYGGLVEPIMTTLLPLDAAWLDKLTAEPWPARGLPMHTMETQALFAALVRQHLFVSVYRGFARSLAAEHAMRFAAMQSAQTNIRDNLSELTSLWRQMRQGAITAELIDAVSRVEALRGKE